MATLSISKGHNSVILPKPALDSLGAVTAAQAATVAKEPITADDVLVSILKDYPEPKFIQPPTDEDLQRKNQIEVGFLQGQLARKNDQIRRLREEVELQIKMLSGMLDGKRETIDYIKRIISKLKGSLEYRGRDDYREL